ncbi:MAG: hypothetical protein QOJ23_4598 [Actinomycetota bacterium]|nr:hypothetical protein [Actinomycetota bacterium]
MSPSRWSRFSPVRILVMLSLILGTVLTAAPAQSLTITPGTVGGFEIDGNEVVNTPGNLDWKNVSPIIVTDDTLDSGFRGDSKELTPGSWVCNTGGANPSKGNILRVYVNPRATATTNFLDLAWVRENVNGTGEVTLEFELNQVASPAPGSFANTPCPVTRTVGDLLVAFDFPGGNAAPVINIFRWTGTTWDPTVAPVTGSGAVNTAPIAAADDIAGIAIDPTRFGEATLDLTGLIGPNGTLPCSAFTQLNTRSRSSNAIDSALQDRIRGIPINLCPNQPQPGHIVVQKDTVPAGATGTFPFVTTGTGYTGFNLSGAGDSHDSGALQPGTYSVAETVPGGWTLTGSTCDGAPYTPGASLTLAAGQTITCIFTDTQVSPPTPGHIIVQKTTVPASTDLFHFTTTYPPGGFSLANGGTNDSGALAPNTYTVSEDTPTGWDLTSAVCRDVAGAVVAGPVNIVLAAGQTITCVFTNTQQGTLEVVKSMDPGDPGRFNLVIDGTTFATNVGNGGTTGAQFVSPVGTHSVGEAAAAGTVLSDYISAVQCVNGQQQVLASGPGTSLAGIAVPAGDHIVCTILNTRGRGSLRVVKALVPATDPGLFDLVIDGTTIVTDRTDGGTTGLVQVDSGSHAVGETAGTGTNLADYTSAVVCTHLVGQDGVAVAVVVASGSGTSLTGVPVGINDDVTCVITNTRRPPAPGSVTIVKDAKPNSSQDFTFTPSAGINGGVSFLLDDDGNSTNALPDSRTFPVTPGVHTVAEAPAAGFDLASIVCDDSDSTGNTATAVATIRVAPGEHVTCTFTNEKHGVYGNDPAVNPVENPYTPGPSPGGQPAGDTGQPGAATPDPATQVAGITVVSPVADPSGDHTNPVLQGVVGAVEGQVNLPRTGAAVVQQAIAGLILIGAGLVLLALRRRRSSSPSA